MTTGRSRPAVGRRGRAGSKSEERGRIYQGFMITRGRRGRRGRKFQKKKKRGEEERKMSEEEKEEAIVEVDR